MTHNPSTVRMTSVSAMQPSLTGNCFTRATRPSDWALGILPQTLGDPTPAVYGVDGFGNAASVFGGCLPADEGLADLDVLSVHYVHSKALLPSELTIDGVYLQSGLGGGVVFQCNVAGEACLAGLTDRRTDTTGTRIHTLISHLYYVRKWHRSANDGIPTLVRVALQPDGGIRHQALVSGVHSFQILYGFDNDGNGEVDQYRSADQLASPSTAAGLSGDWSRVKSVRLGILLASTNSHGADSCSIQTLIVEESAVDVCIGHIGRVFSTTVAIRNPGLASGF